MAESETIKGAAIRNLFEDLRQHKTLLKLTVVDTDETHLTRIRALENRNQAPHFVIDMPQGWAHAAAKKAPRHFLFEFTGKDHIKYTFRTIGAEIDDNRIYVKCPREVERWQRRELFRINAPVGTKLCLSHDALRYELDVIDISIGGTLATLVLTDPHDPDAPPFEDARILKDIELVFPSEIMRQPIQIKTVQLKRLKPNSEKTGYKVAFEFDKINTREQKRLTDLIYRLQRQALRHRLPVDL